MPETETHDHKIACKLTEAPGQSRKSGPQRRSGMAVFTNR